MVNLVLPSIPWRAVAFYSSKVPLWWCNVCVCSAWADEEGIQRPLLDSLLLAVQMRFRIHGGFFSIHDSESQPPAWRGTYWLILDLYRGIMDLNKWIIQTRWVLFHPQSCHKELITISYIVLYICRYRNVLMFKEASDQLLKQQNYWNLYGFDSIWIIELSSISFRWILPDFVNTAVYWCHKDKPASVLTDCASQYFLFTRWSNLQSSEKPLSHWRAK